MSVIRNVTGEEFEEILKKGRVLAEFWAPWCNPCKMMGRLLEAAAVTAPPDTLIVKINVGDFPETAEKFQVTTIPAFLLWENGVLMKRISGILSPAELQKLLGS